MADEIPPAGGPSPGSPPPLDDLWKDVRMGPPTTRRTPPPKSGRVGGAAALVAAAAAAAGLWWWNVAHRPETLVPKLAAEYLEDLRARDYAGAYAMFSEAAKKACTADEFRASRDTTDWTWSDLRLEHQEPGAVLMSYQLSPAGQPPRRDYVLFTWEDGRWTRPYNWTLMRQVESAFDKGNPDQGLIFAQTAATINPRDPMAWGYLCEAAYYRKASADAETLCARAIALAKTYPSDLDLKSLYHLHAILADLYHHALAKPDLALAQYGEMLAFPNISPADQCPLLLARAQIERAAGRDAETAADLGRGDAVCADPQDQAFIRQTRAALRGPAR